MSYEQQAKAIATLIPIPKLNPKQTYVNHEKMDSANLSNLTRSEYFGNFANAGSL